MNSAFGSSRLFLIVRLNLFAITYIQLEELISVKNQHQFMVQLRNQKLVFHTLKETSVDFHRQFQTNHHHLSSNFIYAYEVMYPFISRFIPYK